MLKDDYAVTNAHIIATVSKGSGESVKFREETLRFQAPASFNTKESTAQLTIDLLQLGLEPGDELYFYVEAFDNQQPVANKTRTETFFIALQDTTRMEAVANEGLGVDLMPEYFRSQRQIIIDYPNTAPAAEAAFLAADIHEKTGRMDDAMAAFVEFESRFGKDRRAPESKLRRAQILSQRPALPMQMQARELFNQVAEEYPGTPHAQVALQSKLRMETERKNLRALDPVLKVQVPASMVTLRQVIEQFPDAPQALAARSRLASMLADMNRWAEAAQVLEDLGAMGDPSGEVWFRLGEIYERRLRDQAKARETYAKVPETSKRYAEAQRRATRK